MLRMLAVLLALATAAEAAPPPRQRTIRRTVSRWHAPACATISGVRGFGYVAPDGVVVRGHAADELHAADLPPMTGVDDVVTTSVPNLLYALSEYVLYESRDAGCTWTALGGKTFLPGHDLKLDATHVTRIYAYSDSTLGVVTASGIVPLAPFPARIVSLHVHPSDAQHLRGVSIGGEVYESVDGGATWQFLGDGTSQLVNAAAIDPSDFDRILVMSTEHFPLRVSHDGGRTWTRGGMPMSYPWSIEFSKVDPRVVWAVAWESIGGTPINGLYRSLDGGATWQRVLSESGSLQFSRTKIEPHPRDASIVAFDVNEGVAIFDDGLLTMAVTIGNRPNAMAWSPAGTLYFGEWVLAERDAN